MVLWGSEFRIQNSENKEQRAENKEQRDAVPASEWDSAVNRGMEEIPSAVVATSSTSASE